MVWEEKFGFHLWSINLVFALIGVLQVQTFGCACSKHKWNISVVAGNKIQEVDTDQLKQGTHFTIFDFVEIKMHTNLVIVWWFKKKIS